MKTILSNETPRIEGIRTIFTVKVRLTPCGIGPWSEVPRASVSKSVQVQSSNYAIYQFASFHHVWKVVISDPISSAYSKEMFGHVDLGVCWRALNATVRWNLEGSD